MAKGQLHWSISQIALLLTFKLLYQVWWCTHNLCSLIQKKLHFCSCETQMDVPDQCQWVGRYFLLRKGNCSVVTYEDSPRGPSCGFFRSLTVVLTPSTSSHVHSVVSSPGSTNTGSSGIHNASGYFLLIREFTLSCFALAVQLQWKLDFQFLCLSYLVITFGKSSEILPKDTQ